MNDDYLWDKTGEPDPQIQQLEEILGTLRYQPQPLEIPEDLPVPRRWSYFPWAAIAAALLLALLAGAVWLGMRSRGDAPQRQAEVKAPAAVEEKTTPSPEVKLPEKNQLPGKNEMAVHVRHQRRHSAPALSKQEREEALAAKEQLMLALRLTTEKLSLVHKKTQNTNPANQIKNQHRIG